MTKEEWKDLLFEVQAGNRSCGNMADIILDKIESLDKENAKLKNILTKRIESMSVPTCKSCAHYIRSWNGREFAKCAIASSYGYCNIERHHGKCGMEAKYYTPKPTWLQRLGFGKRS